MTIGKRLAVGFDRTAWIGFGLAFYARTLWVDFFGLYLSVYLGRKH